MSLKNSSVHILIGISFFAITGPVYAAEIKRFDFDVDGVLPSSEVNVEFFNNTAATEDDLYTVEDGVLKQRTINVNGNASYLYPDTSSAGGDLDPTMTTIISSRLRVVSVQGTGGAYFQAFDGANRYGAWFEPAGIFMPSSGTDKHVELPLDDFHEYRLESPADCNALILYVDDAYVAATTAIDATFNGFGFGDGITPAGTGADVDWDSLVVSQTADLGGFDVDQDGVADSSDNCVVVANADQRDTDADGFGNVCDADLDNNCTVNFGDLALFKAAFLTGDQNADFDGSGLVNFGDLATLKSNFLTPPGPSCAPNICYGDTVHAALGY